MASTTAFFTGLSGLSAHARKLDVIGNNIANVNTTAYKSTRLNLETRFPRNFSPGSPPGDAIGGTNPYQVGLGVGISGTQRNHSVGSITPTGDQRDLAIDGDGFFIVERSGEQFYTRNGAFRQDADDNLVTINGERVLGFGVDDDFNIVEGALTTLSIPIGRLRIAEPTTIVHAAGNLNAGGDVAEAGSVTRLLGTATEGLRTLTGGFAASTTALTALADPDSAGALFTAGQVIRLDGATRGGSQVPVAEFEVGAGSTVAQFLSFLNTSLGIHSTTTENPDGSTPGATIDADTGVITIVGNTGVSATIELDPSDLKTIDTDGSLAGLPFVTSNDSASSGESDRTTMIVYDSLGNAVEVTVAFTLEEKTDGGTTWRYDIFSNDNEGGGAYLSSGEVQFDSIGQLVANDPITVSLSRAGTGAASPLSFNILLSSTNGRMTALTDTPSRFSPVYRDGVPTGTLEQFAITDEGIIVGAFDNGVTRNLGQVALARFINNQGLIEEGSSLFRVGANSGQATVTTPGESAAGRITSGALELSNVDLGQEFIELILTQTGYSASSRVIQVTDELMQQLLVLGR
jgi:flagellar hook protein FlgE